MHTIPRDEMEFELEFSRPSPPFATFFHLHARCYAAWELERSPGARHDGGAFLPWSDQTTM